MFRMFTKYMVRFILNGLFSRYDFHGKFKHKSFIFLLKCMEDSDV
jgi:hypothetical protein